jgi:serine/threonine-protein kinase RsbW
MDLSLELTVPSKVEYISVVRLLVASLAASRRALADERVDDLKLAVSEACTNAIEANQAEGSDGVVVVRAWEAPERMEVCISDSGSGFDPSHLPDRPLVSDPLRLNFERGLGIPLIRSLVDSVRFDCGAGGTSAWLTVFGGPAGEEGDATSEIVRVVAGGTDSA